MNDGNEKDPKNNASKQLHVGTFCNRNGRELQVKVTSFLPPQSAHASAKFLS